jgi:hypothetical protein
MKKLLIFLSLIAYLSVASSASAIVNPLETPNNKIGIHILFPSELEEAAKLVNSSGGEWGYVTLPIQAGDKDIDKWQTFMDECKRLKLIPIIRLATEGDYFNTKVWRKPDEEDIMDFANFLNSLSWPTKNRYIIVFNEVNRGDEWGGSPNPEEYAKLLDFAVVTFKTAHEDFFMISGGMDNAAPNKSGEYMNQYTYMHAMNQSVPDIFTKVDGLSSHSYPNPGFSQPFSVQTQMSISSFRYERQLAKTFGGKELPIFITETGWTGDKVPDELRGDYYYQALTSVWNDTGIVTVAPFLLRAHSGPFQQFTFLNQDGKETKQYTAVKNYPKVKGRPVTPPQPKILAETVAVVDTYPTISFAEDTVVEEKFSLSDAMQSAFRWIMKL